MNGDHKEIDVEEATAGAVHQNLDAGSNACQCGAPIRKHVDLDGGHEIEYLCGTRICDVEGRGRTIERSTVCEIMTADRCPECGARVVVSTSTYRQCECRTELIPHRDGVHWIAYHVSAQCLRNQLFQSRSDASDLKRRLEQTQREIQHLNWVADEMMRANRHYAERNGRLWTENIRLHQVVECVEWGGPFSDRRGCPVCGRHRLEGHAPDCELATALFKTQERYHTALASEEQWQFAWDEMRDAVLNERGPLAEIELTSDQINAVLAVIDDARPGDQKVRPISDEPVTIDSEATTADAILGIVDAGVIQEIVTFLEDFVTESFESGRSHHPDPDGVLAERARSILAKLPPRSGES